MVSSKDLRIVQRGCTNRDVRKVILSALKSGVRYRMTRSGVMIYGPTGFASAHFTVSDRRGYKNLIAGLRQAGIQIKEK